MNCNYPPCSKLAVIDLILGEDPTHYPLHLCGAHAYQTIDPDARESEAFSQWLERMSEVEVE